MIKPEYILLREKKDGVVFSSMTVEVPKEFDKFIKDKNFTLRCSESSYNPETDILYKNKVYQTKQGFFLYLSLTEETMVIYYGEDQLNELTLFIRQLFKQLKNATNNDKRTEREN
jgi:hypothetical protein